MHKRTNKIVFDTLSKYNNKITNTEKQQLVEALKRELIVKTKGIIFLIDSEEAKMTSLANIGSGYEPFMNERRERRKPLEIISDMIRRYSIVGKLSVRDYKDLVEIAKKLKVRSK